MSDKEKQYTLKSARSELTRLEKSKESKTEKIQQLRAELKEINTKIKELEAVYDTLYHEDLQRQIAAEWFREQKLTGEQIMKFLELSKHLHDKIDVLDIATVVQAVNAAYQGQKDIGVDTKTAAQNIFTDYSGTDETKEEKVDTCINFSDTHKEVNYGNHN